MIDAADILNEPRWEPAVEAGFDTGVISAAEADRLDPPDDLKEMSPPEPAGEIRIFRAPRPGYIKDGSRRKIITAADSRAADRLPDDQWMLR